ncbi:MAG: hypothetical protein ACREOQ_01895 [Gemmatimonadales bacterium]
MLGQRSFAFALAAAATVALGSCSDDATLPSAPSAPSTTPDLLTRAQQDLADDPVALARAVPGFGGFFVDEQGTPTVYLASPGGRAVAEQALAPWFRERNRSAAALRVLPGRFAWTDLERWSAQAATEALAVPGAVFVDADEAGNRVHIGVEHTGAASRVRSVLARLGIPAAATAVDIVPPIHQVATLRTSVRPVVAGVQINFPGFLCTLGFNATRGGVAGFVTASHCTNTQGGIESTPYWQPTQTAKPVQIGTETVDPGYKSTLAGCPSGRRCRRSDAAFAKYINGTTNTRGKIARTASMVSSDLTIAGAWTITSNAASSSFTVGETVNKVGRTTGWSRGKVVATCVTVNVSGATVTQICQTIVNAKVGAGDSGSDVFTVSSGTNVKLDGVLWGASADGKTFVFSPLANITGELGALTTH